MTRIRIIAAFVVACAAAACGSHDPVSYESEIVRPALNGTVVLQDPSLGPVRDEFAALVADGDLVSLSVGVARHGEVIWAESFGLADRESGRPATPDTPYLLASLSKSVSAATLMTLIDDGTISLDDSVNDLIAPLALTGYGGRDPGRVTVRDILHGSGGVPHGWFSTADPVDLPRRDAFLPWSGMVVFPPGEVWEYSNFSLGLTELVAEAVTGETYEDFIDGALFAPLGMDDASARYTDSMGDQSAVLYSSSQNRLRSRAGAMPFAGLGMFASVNDLLAFGIFNLDPGQGGPLSPENVALMHGYEGLSEIFGLGWYYVNDTLVSNGSAGGTNTHLAVHPGENLVVVALTNMTSQNAITDQIVDKIKAAFVPPLPADQTYDYADYAAVYENPYVPTPAFVGRWNGRLQAPSLSDVPASLTFAADGSAALAIDDGAPLVLEGLVYNTKNRFMASTTGHFPPLFPDDVNAAGEATILPSLLKEGDRLAGYLQIEREGQDHSYSVGVFAEFLKAD